jgi:hypothetical protein
MYAFETRASAHGSLAFQKKDSGLCANLRALCGKKT